MSGEDATCVLVYVWRIGILGENVDPNLLCVCGVETLGDEVAPALVYVLGASAGLDLVHVCWIGSLETRGEVLLGAGIWEALVTVLEMSGIFVGVVFAPEVLVEVCISSTQDS